MCWSPCLGLTTRSMFSITLLSLSFYSSEYMILQSTFLFYTSLFWVSSHHFNLRNLPRSDIYTDGTNPISRGLHIEDHNYLLHNLQGYGQARVFHLPVISESNPLSEIISHHLKSTSKSRSLYQLNSFCVLQFAMASILSLIIFYCWKSNNAKELRMLLIFFQQ